MATEEVSDPLEQEQVPLILESKKYVPINKKEYNRMLKKNSLMLRKSPKD